jgi:hypothetical protein
VTNIIIVIIFGEFSQPGEKKRMFLGKMGPIRHITREKKTKVAIFIAQLPTSRQIIGEVFSIL